jgi:DNA polymerase III delta prime subunit
MSNPFDSIFVEKYRPKTLDDIVLSKEDREFFESLATKQEIPHLLFAGAPGVGKTSLAHIITRDILKCDSIYINSSDENSVDVVRHKITNFAKTKSFDGNLKIVILDEACGMTSDSQRILRSVMESFAENTRFILTSNYLHRIIPALQSRCQIVNLNPPVEGIVARVVSILKYENITIPEDQKPLLLKHIKANLPDIRRIVNDIQQYSVTGTLQLRSDDSSEFAEKIFKKICNKGNLIDIRKEVIENEKAFSYDYRSLLKQLFETVFKSELPYEKKTECLLIISKSMHSDAFVVDKEINCFSSLIRLHNHLNN